MKQITQTDIHGPAIYSQFRDRMYKDIIALKKHRRVHLGEKVMLVFENRATLIFQIEEMLRAESITEPDKVQEEIDVYNELLPTDDSLSATLFIAVPQDESKRAELDRLIGLDEHVVIHIGDHAIRAAFEPGRSTEDRISAVQYTRYPLTPAAKQALLTPGTVLWMEIDHPEYRERADLSEEMRQSLAGDYQA